MRLCSSSSKWFGGAEGKERGGIHTLTACHLQEFPEQQDMENRQVPLDLGTAQTVE